MRPTSFVLVALAVLGAGSSPASVSAAESGSATASATLSGTKTSAPTASIIRPPAQNTLEPLPWPTLWDTMLKVTSGELTLPYNFKTLEKLVNANPTLKNLLWGKVDYAYKNMTWFAFTDDAYKAMDTAFGAGYTKYVEGLSADLIKWVNEDHRGTSFDCRCHSPSNALTPSPATTFCPSEWSLWNECFRGSGLCSRTLAASRL